MDLEDLSDLSIFDIDFKEIGGTLYRSLDGSLRRLAQSLNIKALPPARDPEVVAIKPPEETKSKLLKAATYLGGIFSIVMIIEYAITFLNVGNLRYLFYTVISGLSMGIWFKTNELSKKYKVMGNKYRRYLRELGTNTVISVRDLAGANHQTEEETVEDLLYMMDNEYFKQARLVENGTMFILDVPTYKLYKEKVLELPKDQSTKNSVTTEEISTDRATEIIRTGRTCLNKLEAETQIIKNHEIKAYIKRISMNAESILEIIDKYPDKTYALGKFAEYYLPTAVKLSEAYREFELLGSADSKVNTSMKEIKKSLDNLGDAFEKIKDELLKDRAMDIQTDIDTINLLLNQEGYNDDWSTDE